MVMGPNSRVPIDTETVHVHRSPVGAGTIRIHESPTDIENIHDHGSMKDGVQIPRRSDGPEMRSWML